MDQDQLRALLAQVSAGAVDVDAALERLRHMPFEDLGFAKVDHHRALRVCRAAINSHSKASVHPQTLNCISLRKSWPSSRNTRPGER